MTFPYHGSGIFFFRRTSSGLEVLLFKRAVNPHKGKWSLVGGRIEPNETPIEAAWREVGEEAFCLYRNAGEKAMKAFASCIEGTIESPAKMKIAFPFFRMDVFGYLVKAVPKGFPTLNFENSEARWHRLTYLPYELHLFTRKEVLHLAKAISNHDAEGGV